LAPAALLPDLFPQESSLRASLLLSSANWTDVKTPQQLHTESFKEANSTSEQSRFDTKKVSSDLCLRGTWIPLGHCKRR
jgi:hypothetical protein